MKNVIPMNAAHSRSQDGGWLVGAEDGAACAVRLIDQSSLKKGTLTVTPYDRFVFVIKGTLDVVIGDESMSVGSDSLIHVPKDTPYAHASAGPVRLVEVVAPGGAALDTQRRESPPKHIDNASRFVHQIDMKKFGNRGFASEGLADRSTGSDLLRFNVVQVQAGAGSPDYHIHNFDQYYIILEGEMTIDIGRQRTVAPADSLVVLPMGLVHRNFNATGGIERHLTLIVPEPKAGEIFDFAVEIHNHEAVRLKVSPDVLSGPK